MKLSRSAQLGMAAGAAALFLLVLLKSRSAAAAARGWGGSERVAQRARGVAASLGIPVTSEKRTLADTVRVGSTTASDHYTGNTLAYALDFGVAGSRGDELARRLAHEYGIPLSHIGTHKGHLVRDGGAAFRVQLLWRVAGHFDHVHLGIRRAS